MKHLEHRRTTHVTTMTLRGAADVLEGLLAAELQRVDAHNMYNDADLASLSSAHFYAEVALNRLKTLEQRHAVRLERAERFAAVQSERARQFFEKSVARKADEGPAQDQTEPEKDDRRTDVCSTCAAPKRAVVEDDADEQAVRMANKVTALMVLLNEALTFEHNHDDGGQCFRCLANDALKEMTA